MENLSTDLQFGGPGAPPQPWKVSGGTISYDGSVLVPSNVVGGAPPAGSINTNDLYVKGVRFVNPVGVYLPLTGGALTGPLGILNTSNISIGGGTSGQLLAINGAGGLSWTSNIPGGPYLPLAGGTIAGSLYVTNSLELDTPTNLALGGGSAGQYLQTNGAGGLSWVNLPTITAGPIAIGDTPPASPSVGALWWDSTGGQLYVWYADPSSSQWVVTNNLVGAYLAITGGTLTGPLILAADPIVTLGAATKQYVDNASYLKLSGGTLIGALNLAADPAGPLQPTTRQYVDTNHYGGFINKLRNGTFDIWQRGNNPSLTASGVYTAYGWLVSWNGTAPAFANRAVSGLNNCPAGCLAGIVLGGAAGNTQVGLYQIIESNIAVQLGNLATSVTFSFWAYSNSLNITPTFSVSYPTTPDTRPYTNVILNPVNLQTIPNTGVWTRLAYTFTLPAGVSLNGIQVSLIFPNLTSGQLVVTACDLRATPNLPVGLCANPPPPELRPIYEELLFCQRYFQVSGYLYGFAFAATSIAVCWYLKTNMRAAATLSLVGTSVAGESPPLSTSRTATGATINPSHASANASSFDFVITGFTGMTAFQPASILPGWVYASAEL